MHLMIDLETLSTKPTAAFQQVGLAFFNKERMLEHTVYFVDMQSCINLGLTIDWETIKWWMEKDGLAKANFIHDGWHIQEALQALSSYIRYMESQYGDLKGIWSHGASFDIPILENAYHKCKLASPFPYKIIRDTRTLFELYDYKLPKVEDAHCADVDAVNQANGVIACWNSNKQGES